MDNIDAAFVSLNKLNKEDVNGITYFHHSQFTRVIFVTILAGILLLKDTREHFPSREGRRGRKSHGTIMESNNPTTEAKRSASTSTKLSTDGHLILTVSF